VGNAGQEMRTGREPVRNGRVAARAYGQVAETIFTLLTVRLRSAPAAVVLLLPDVPVALRSLGLLDDVLAPDEGDDDALELGASRPITSILWPTCFSRSELSPLRRNFMFAADADEELLVALLLLLVPVVPVVALVLPAGAIMALLRTYSPLASFAMQPITLTLPRSLVVALLLLCS